jgi:chaperonin GroEL
MDLNTLDHAPSYLSTHDIYFVDHFFIFERYFMAHRKAKDAPKIYMTDPLKLKHMVLNTMRKVSEIVGSTLGPGGKNCLLESDYPGIPNKNTKDGVTVFKSLGSIDPYEHLIIEQARDAAIKTATEAGDGTTTATVLSYAIIQNLFEFCEKNPKYSPQKAARKITKVAHDLLVPFIRSRSIAITEDNKHFLKMVAKVSANGDEELADSVMECFEQIGFGDSSHITIRELSGPHGYKVEKIDGFPIPIGLEESIGRLHTAFINDQGNQRCFLEKPLFLLFDGQINDLVTFLPLLDALGKKYVEEGNSDYKNLVIFSYGYSENVLTQLAFNFANPNTLNVLPVVAPLAPFMNSQLHFLHDLAAFTGAKVFGLRDQISTATPQDLGAGMEMFECYRFRSTVVGDPDPTNVEFRADELRTLLQQPEGQADKMFLIERLGKITNGIAKLTIYGGSNGELREIHDRSEDAICALRSAITNGALPGGGRIALDMAIKLAEELPEGDPAREVLIPSLIALPNRLLDNAGYISEEISEILTKLTNDQNIVYDIENQVFGKAEELGLLDAAKAVEEAVVNAVSIASVLGTMGGIVCHPRDAEFERTEARADAEFGRAVSTPDKYVNEANERP